MNKICVFFLDSKARRYRNESTKFARIHGSTILLPTRFFIFINIHIHTLILRYFKLLPTAMKKKVCYAKYSVPLKFLLLYYVVVKCGSLYKMIKNLLFNFFLRSTRFKSELMVFTEKQLDQKRSQTK